MPRAIVGRLGALRVEAAPITHDRACLRCGYNLRGLKVGANCPECGERIPPISRATDAALDRMPFEVIRVFRLGSWLAAGAMAVMLVANFEIILTWEPPRAVRNFGTGVALIFWICSVWMLTPAMHVPEAVARGFHESGVARQIARWCQMGWVVLAISFALRAGFFGSVGKLDGVVETIGIVGSIVGIIGLIAMSVMMERLAEWARDSTAETAFQTFEWVLPLVLLGMIALPLYSRLGQVATIIGFVVLLLFPIGILMLSASIMYSAVHHGEHADREERRSRRRQEEKREVFERLDMVSDGVAESRTGRKS